jgi:hypothetical protein
MGEGGGGTFSAICALMMGSYSAPRPAPPPANTKCISHINAFHMSSVFYISWARTPPPALHPRPRERSALAA